MAAFEILRSTKNREYFWQLKANNGKIICLSGETYAQKRDCQYGIQLVKDFAAKSTVEDNS